MNILEQKGGLADIERTISSTSNAIGQVENVEEQGTKRVLKSRHAQMIAIGGTIGTGLFVGTGQALAKGGPLFLLLAYIILSIVVYGVVTATTEMSSYLPVRGCSMSYYGTRFFSRSLGFALGWQVQHQAISSPSLTNHASSKDITVTMVVIFGLNCFSARVYGEAEFWFASIKIMGIIGLLIMALILVSGGGPSGHALGFHYWKDPGPVNEYLVDGVSGRLCAFIATITFSILAFVFAPELLVVTGGEMEDPRRNLPIAGRRYFYRLIFFYVLGVFFIGLIIARDDPNLFGNSKGSGASPWAIAAKNAGIQGLDSVINAVIITSAWSAGNSYLFLASRALYSLALVGNAPAFLAKCTDRGIPYYALICTSSFSFLAYLNCSSSGVTVFNWFVNLINTGGYQSWICCSLIYLRFRQATHDQHINDTPFRSVLQPYLTYFNLCFLSLLMMISGFSVFIHGKWSTSSFLTAYLGIPIVLILYLGHRYSVGRHDNWYRTTADIDLTSGLEEVLVNEEHLSRPSSRKKYQVWRLIYE